MSIRRTILENSGLFEMIREKFSDFQTDPDALALAIEGHFRGTSDLVAIDGFEFLYVMEETQTTLNIVGMAYFLPSSLIPLEATFQSVNDGISYRVFLGSEDEVWHGLTKKKRWSAVYLFATEGYDPQWNWDQPLDGLLRLKMGR